MEGIAGGPVRRVRVGDVFAPQTGNTLVVVTNRYVPPQGAERLDVICNQIDAARGIHGRAKCRHPFPNPNRKQIPDGWYLLERVRREDIRRQDASRWQCAEAAVAVHPWPVNDMESGLKMWIVEARKIVSAKEWWDTL